MNIADLKKLIKDLPDDAIVGVTDRFGALETVDASDFTYYAPNEHGRVKQAFFRLPNVEVGPDPG